MKHASPRNILTRSPRVIANLMSNCIERFPNILNNKIRKPLDTILLRFAPQKHSRRTDWLKHPFAHSWHASFITACLLLSTTCPLIYAEHEKSPFENYFEKANSLFGQAKFDEAIETYKTALTLETKFPQVYYNLGMSYLHQQKYDEALLNFEKAIAISPSYTKAYLQAGHALQKKEKYEQAYDYYKKTLDQDPKSAEAHLNSARVLGMLCRFEQATTHAQRAVELDPKDGSNILELGNIYNMCNKIPEALEAYNKLALLLPNDTCVTYNIGYTLKKLGKIDEAMEMYKKVLAAKPEHPDAHFGLGLCHMLLGDFDKGWPEYEWRWNRSGYSPRKFKYPEWDGIASINGKTLFLHSEQGLGDTLQFVRYARVAKEMGATVIVAVQQALITLMKECPYIDKVISLQDTCPPCDYHAALMSMPLLLKTNINTVPDTIPYLHADPALVAYWREKLSHDKGVKIGICWQGNPNYSTHFLRVTVAAKSLPVTMFSALGDVPNICVYSLQRESGIDQLKSLNNPFDLHTFNDDFDKAHGRFMDTAAVIKLLDLVITVDTSIAHLAAGLGVPTWTFIPEPPDWRWMLNRTDTPWYPNMRLFRQPTPGDWQTVINTIKSELQEFINQKQG